MFPFYNINWNQFIVSFLLRYKIRDRFSPLLFAHYINDSNKKKQKKKNGLQPNFCCCSFMKKISNYNFKLKKSKSISRYSTKCRHFVYASINLMCAISCANLFFVVVALLLCSFGNKLANNQGNRKYLKVLFFSFHLIIER